MPGRGRGAKRRGKVCGQEEPQKRLRSNDNEEPEHVSLSSMQDHSASNREIWLIGDSLVKRAMAAAGASGHHLGLESRGYSVLWQGQSGMKWQHLRSAFQLRMLAGGSPAFLILHLGGNDVVDKDQCLLKWEIFRDIKFMAQVLPNTQFVWFDIIPRLQWRGASVDQAKQLDLKRKRINRFGRQAVCETGRGHFISTNINRLTPGFYSPDGVHLSPIGEKMYLLTLEQALETFINNENQISFVQEA